MKNIRCLVVVIAAWCCLAAGCRQSQNNDAPPDNVLPKEKFQGVLLDVLLADAYAAEKPVPQDTQKIILNKAYGQIFDRHGVTRNEFFNTLSYYNRHPKEFTAILEPVKDSLSTLEEKSGE